MYSTIVIDDEELIRTVIVDFINNEVDEFSVAAIFSNGQEALEYIYTHRPDVIISDIRMPQMSGLELAQIIHDEHLEIPLIIVSGYSDFAYAKQALQYGVYNYILKPIDFDELKTNLLRIRTRLMARKPAAKKNDQIALFLTYVLAGLFQTSREIIRAAGLIALPSSVINAPCCIWKISVTSIEFLENQEHEHLCMLIEEALRCLLCDVHAYLICELDWHFYFVIIGETTAEEDHRRFIESVRAQYGMELSIDCITQSRNLPGLCQVMSADAFGELLRQSISSNEIHDGSIITDEKSFVKNGRRQEIFEKATAFIHANYAKNISRADVANAIYVSQSYFSHLFNETAGMSFSEYLNRLRMEKAVELLAHPLKISQIIEQTGYRTKKSFLVNFRACTGMTPSEYRQQIFYTKDYDDE